MHENLIMNKRRSRSTHASKINKAGLRISEFKVLKNKQKRDQKDFDSLLDGKPQGAFKMVKLDDSRGPRENCTLTLTNIEKARGSLGPILSEKVEKRVSHKTPQALIRIEERRKVRIDYKMKVAAREIFENIKSSPLYLSKFREVVKTCEIFDDEDFEIRKKEDSFTQLLNSYKREFDENRGTSYAQLRLKNKLKRLGKTLPSSGDSKALSKVDSLVESAYNSQKASEWGKEPAPFLAPKPSLDSLDDYYIYGNNSEDSSSTNSNEHLQVNQYVKPNLPLYISEESNPVEEEKMAALGFQRGFKDVDPTVLIQKIKDALEVLRDQGTTITQDVIQTIYKRICRELQAAPINIFNYLSKDVLNLNNYGLSLNQVTPISYVIPFFTELQHLIIKYSKLSDKGAALIINSALVNSQMQHVDLSGSEVGHELTKSFKLAMDLNPHCVKELVLEDMKIQISMSRLIQVISRCASLEYLSLRGNQINVVSAGFIANLVKETKTLELLNISRCKIGSTTSEIVLNALMLNTTLKFLDLSHNQFSSKNNIVASKLGRLVQGHPQLLHINLSHCSLLREELLFVVLSVRDSKNIQGIHLTGNNYSYYDRLLMRGLIPSLVRWPQPPASGVHFEQLSARDRTTLVMLNGCIMDALPPSQIPEIGTQKVTTVQEVKERIRSLDKRKQIEEQALEAKKVEGSLDKTQQANNLLKFKIQELKQQRPFSEVKTILHVPDSNQPSHRSSPARKISGLGQDSTFEEQQNTDKMTLQKYFEKPVPRIHDMYQMIDFYGINKLIKELGGNPPQHKIQIYDDMRQREEAQEARMKQFEKKKLNSELSAFNQNLNQSDSLDSQNFAYFASGIDFEDEQKRAEREKERQDNLIMERVKYLLQMIPENIQNEKGTFNNPMRGHARELIFSRVTGHPDLPENNQWFDCAECWVCEEWSKVNFVVRLEERHLDQEFQDIIVLTAFLKNRMRTRLKEAKEANRLAVLSEGTNSIESEELSDSELDDQQIFIQDPNLTKKRRLKTQENSRAGRTTFKQQLEIHQTVNNFDMANSGENFDFIDEMDEEEMLNQKNQNRLQRYTKRQLLSSREKSGQGQSQDNDEDFDSEQELDLEKRHLNFAHFSQARDNLTVRPKLNNLAEISDKDPNTNITLYNWSLTARPIQFKNILKNVHKEYDGLRAPDRFNQANFKYCVRSGILFRNFNNDATMKEHKRRAQMAPSLKKQSSIKNKASSSNQIGGTNRRLKKEDEKDDPNLMLMKTSQFCDMRGNVTRFDCQDSQIACKISNTIDFYKKRRAQNTQNNSQIYKQDGELEMKPKLTAHQKWLKRKGFSITGKLPQVCPKGDEFSQRMKKQFGLDSNKGEESSKNAQETTCFDSEGTTNRDQMIQPAWGFFSSSQNQGKLLELGAEGGHRIQQRQANTSHTTVRQNRRNLKIKLNDKGLGKIPDDYQKMLNRYSERQQKTLQTPVKRERNVTKDTLPTEAEINSQRQFWAILNTQNNQSLFLIASFNSWLPIELQDGEVEQASEQEQKVAQQRTELNPKKKNSNIHIAALTSVQHSQFQPNNKELLSLAAQKTSILNTQHGMTNNSDLHLQNDSQGSERFGRSTTAIQDKVQQQQGRDSSLTTRSVKRPKNLAQLIPPGKHHFFFIRNGKTFMLSNRYEIENYKETNIKMNFVEIEKRGWRIPEPIMSRDEEWKQIAMHGDCYDEAFDKSRSVFKNYKLDSNFQYNRMFEFDFNLTKIGKLIKDKDAIAQLKSTLRGFYPMLKNVYLSIVCDSVYPNLNLNDFLIFASRLDLFNRPGIANAEIENLFIASIFKTDVSKKIEVGKNEMMRFEFLELTVRMAMLLYRNELSPGGGGGSSGGASGSTGNNNNSNPAGSGGGSNSKKKGSVRQKGISLATAVERLVEEHLLPAQLDVANAQEFRDNFLYSFRVDQYFENNERVLKTIHKQFGYAGKQVMTSSDAVYFLHSVIKCTHVHERMIFRMFGFSKQSVINLERNYKSLNEISYIEFLEFFGRISHVIFQHSEKYAEMPLWEKIDAVLLHICKEQRLSPPAFNVLTDLKQEYIPEVILEFQQQRERQSRMEKAEQDQKLLQTTDKISEGSKTALDDNTGNVSRSSTSQLGIKVNITNSKGRSRPTSSQKGKQSPSASPPQKLVQNALDPEIIDIQTRTMDNPKVTQI